MTPDNFHRCEASVELKYPHYTITDARLEVKRLSGLTGAEVFVEDTPEGVVVTVSCKHCNLIANPDRTSGVCIAHLLQDKQDPETTRQGLVNCLRQRRLAQMGPVHRNDLFEAVTTWFNKVFD